MYGAFHTICIKFHIICMCLDEKIESNCGIHIVHTQQQA